MTTAPHREGGVRRWLAERYLRRHRRPGARAASRHLYGAIIVLAVLVTADTHQPHPFEAAAVLAGTVAVLLGMETYADVVAQEISLQRRLTKDERLDALRDLRDVTLAAEVPLTFLVLAGLGTISDSLGFFLAKAATIALLFYYGFVARRLAGLSRRSALSGGVAVAGIGLVLAVAKGSIHL